MLKFLFAILVVAVGSSAFAADKPMRPGPRPSAKALVVDCARVEVVLHNWHQPAVFRVTAVGGKVPNGLIQTPARWNPGDRYICIPREFFQAAEKIEVCIGKSSRDNSNSRLIQNRWMQIARANLVRGDVVNPGQPMHFRYNGPSRTQRPAVHRQKPGFRPYRSQWRQPRRLVVMPPRAIGPPRRF